MQATPGVDFVSSSGVVEIGDNETTADVQITIKPVSRQFNNNIFIGYCGFLI